MEDEQALVLEQAATNSGKTEWVTVEEAAVHFRSSEWWVRKTATEMAALGVIRHPFQKGERQEWLIDLSAMADYLRARTSATAKHSHYLKSRVDANLPGDHDEDWGWE